MRIWTTIAIIGLLSVPIQTVWAQAILLPLVLQQSAADTLSILPLAPHQGGAEPLSANETHPNAKRLASQIALALTTYADGETEADIAGRLGFAGQHAVELAPLLYVPGTWSEGRIIYPQLGGLTDTRISVMVVTEQLVGTDTGLQAFVRTLDIRLVMSNGIWRFDRLASTGVTPVMPPTMLSAEALAVVNDPRIEMPDSARWDIFSGQISDKLLRLMARLADITPYGVVTLSEGHPYEVFGTDRQSDHTRGRAVDIYRIGENLVIDEQAQGTATYEVVRWLYDQPELSQVGSPWDIDGSDRRSFTDRVHLDHLHVAVTP